MDKILLASNNQYKIKEFNKILQGRFDLVSQSHLNIEEIEETGLSFVENAILKARNASKAANLPAIADDSGIEVDALSGRPGIYSARYAGLNCDDNKNNKLLLKELKNIPLHGRTARYQCVIVYMPFYDHLCQKFIVVHGRVISVSRKKGKMGLVMTHSFFYRISNAPPRSCQKRKKIRLVIVGKLYLYLKRTFWNKKV